MGCPGRYVKIEFSSADASTAAAVSLYDDQHNEVTLGSDEILRIDDLNVDVASGAADAQIFADADDDGTVDDGERIGRVSAGDHRLAFGPEGIACPQGIVPKVLTTSPGNVTVVGTGRIQNNSSPATRPSWREDTHQS